MPFIHCRTELQAADPIRTSAIVAAFDEAPTIGDVVRALSECDLIDEVIVVDDGSTDGTGDRIAQVARCLRNERRLGKGESMERAVREARGRILCFVDADLIGLTPLVVSSLVQPVLTGQADMTVGLRWLFRYRNPLARSLIARLGGERVLTRELWDAVPDRFRSGYQIEAALNATARRTGARVVDLLLPGVKQVVKERKRGIARGLRARACMVVELVLAYTRLSGFRWSR